MIQRYKKVSIIYGGKGLSCAQAIHRKLKELHDREGMPVESHLLAEELLSSADIVSRVRDILSSSTRCIVLLSFDDAGGTRVRQNVLIEIGMALMLLKREQCYVVSEKHFLPDDFPSDIRGALNPNYLDLRDAEAAADRIVQTIAKSIRLKSHQKILEDQKYTYDYTKILDDIPGKVFEKKPDLQMADILDAWLENVYSFTFTEERILYILERVVFFPIFPGNEKMRHFLTKLKDAVRTEVRDFTEEETEELVAGRALVMRVLEYTELRQDGGRSLVPIGRSMLSYEFLRIAEELETFTERCDSGEINMNWYLQIIALNYAALARMQMMNADPEESAGPDEVREKMIVPLKRVNEIMAKNCKRAGELWNGFVYYNLSRAYEKLYMREQEEASVGAVSGQEVSHWISEMRENSLRSIVIRRHWIGNGMKGIFSTALSYEYFLAMKYEYELCEKIPKYSEKPRDKRAEDIRGTLAELSVYCKTTGLEKLFAIRESFEEMIK